MDAASWIYPRPEGLFVEPGDFFIDPVRPVPRAVISHGHSDHARPGMEAVWATPETLGIMKARYGPDAGHLHHPLPPHQPVDFGPVRVTLVPAGHVLGSAQVVVEHHGTRVVYSGDYKRQPDPTCAPFEVLPCDVFITEATFGLPVFVHPPPASEILKLLESLRLFPHRTHVIGVYALGKAQRLLRLLREAGYTAPVYLHGALQSLCDFYIAQGIELGELRPATVAARDELARALVLAPPSALREPWARRLHDPVIGAASGWMTVRQRARQQNVELPLILSDHADWPALLQTIRETGAGEIWVTHGQEDALIRQCTLDGLSARPLALARETEEN
jgi:putative mRNA 3-end processing factor